MLRHALFQKEKGRRKMIQVTEGTYQGYGRCLTISNGTIEAVVTLDCGPRIIRFAAIGGANVMMEDTERSINKQEFSADFADKFGADKGVWYIYGGHRLWTSPEELPRSYYPDNTPVEYEKVAGGAKFTPPAQVWTQLQMSMTVTMSETDNSLHILHEITNVGAWNAEFAPWALSVLAPGGFEVVPVQQRQTGLLSNRKLVLWDYARMNDDRVYWGEKYITLRQDPTAEGPFKIGTDSEHCWAAYFNHGDLFIKKFDTDPDGVYPDGGCNFETYTCADFLEMESLGTLKSVAPNETVSHCEDWTLYTDVPCPACDEAEIAKVMEKYI